MDGVRPITEADLPALGNLLDSVFRQPRNVFDQNILTDFPLVFVPENYVNSRVAVVDGRIVSHAAIWPRRIIVDGEELKAGGIAVVATDPAYRQRGFAASLMRDLQQTLEEEYFDLGFLWTGVPDFYRKLGWRVVVPAGRLYGVKLSALPESTHEILPYDVDRHLDDVIALHELEAVRTKRTRGEYATLLALPKVSVWIAKRDGRMTAYLVHGRAVNKCGVIEYGGDAEGILALTAHALRDAEMDQIDMTLFHPRSDLMEELDRRGTPSEPLECSKGLGCEMVYPIARSAAYPLDRLFFWGLDQL